MRTIPAAMLTKLQSGDFTGDARATTRVTVQKFLLRAEQYGGYTELHYATPLFVRSFEIPKELPNLRSVTWERSVDQEVGTCSITMLNAKPPVPGEKNITDSQEFDNKGYYTYNRGGQAISVSEWGHYRNSFKNLLVPDRMVRVYQGYGADYTKPPEQDPNLLLMGIYLIDDVIYNADGEITIECRDLGRLLQDQIAFPPVVPLQKTVYWQVGYPMRWEPYREVDLPDKQRTTNNPVWVKPTYDTSSAVQHVGINGSVYGHHGLDAFDNDRDTYWLSTGCFDPKAAYSYEWVQGKFNNPSAVTAVRADVWAGPYTWYLSVQVNGVWQGAPVVPYDPNHPSAEQNGSNIPFVATGRVDKDGRIEVLGLNYANVTAVRLCFTDLYDSGLGTNRHRCGVRTFEVLTTAPTTQTIDGGTIITGNFGDYSSIVKKLLAFGGFHWPPGATQELTQGVSTPYVFAEHVGDLMLETEDHRLQRLLR